jgi:hypothetical protein
MSADLAGWPSLARMDIPNVFSRAKELCSASTGGTPVSSSSNHSEMVCSSLLCARSSRSTEYGARRVGSW